MSSPAVSVIIPCFNLGEYLDEAVASVQSQTFQDFEILIVDDGSTDPATVRLFEHYSRPRTRVFRTPNRGLAKARNYLIGHATGKYLCALDADDKLHPQFLEKTVGLLERDPSLAFVSPHLQMFGEQERIWPEESACDLATLLFDDTVTTSALVRRELVEALGGYDERMPHQGNEDWDLWLSLVEAGHRGVIIPDVLFFYRRRRGSMCEQCTTGQTHLDLIEYMMRKHQGSYRSNVLSVLLRKENRIAGLLSGNAQREMQLHQELLPTLERRRAELSVLRGRLQALRPEQKAVDQPTPGPTPESRALEALSAEYRRARDEIDALRASMSWKLTAPLRIAYDAVTFWRRR